MAPSARGAAVGRLVRAGALGLVALVVLAGCRAPDQAATASAGAVSASPGQQRPIPATPAGTPVSIPATPSSTATAAARNPTLLAQLRQAQTLTIERSFAGLAFVWFSGMSVELRRTGESFTGTAHYTAKGSYSHSNATTTRAIVIPVAVIMNFVEVLADAPLHEGAYKPSITHTDDYPKLSIVLTTPNGTVMFHSESQGKDHLPWGATIGGRSYIIEYSQPMIALERLEPYLRYEATTGALRLEIYATHGARLSPTPSTPPFCRTPVAGQATPTPVVVPTPASSAPRVAPGAVPHPGEVINLTRYFGLADATYLFASGNFSPVTLTDERRIAPLAVLLDHDATMLALPANVSTAESIDFDLTVRGQPVHFTYLPQPDLVSFTIAGQSYAIAAPPSFRNLWVHLICPGAR